MKGFLEEYGLIIVVVAVILLMLLFGKSGYAKSIQDAILGSADHIVETGENITKSDKKEVHVTAGDTLDIEGTKYVVLEEREGYQALVIATSSINKSFQSGSRSDGRNDNTYEKSTIDNYLENEWYNGLSSKMKAAIQITDIQQSAYTNDTDNDGILDYDNNHHHDVYNVLKRHVFLPSVSEIGKAVDLKNPDKVTAFLTGHRSVILRDSYLDSSNQDDFVTVLNYSNGCVLYDASGYPNQLARPAFTIDLSKVDYKVAGHTDYK